MGEINKVKTQYFKMSKFTTILSIFYSHEETCVLMFEVKDKKLILMHKLKYKKNTIREFLKNIDIYNRGNYEKLINNHSVLANKKLLTNLKVVEVPENSTTDDELGDLYLSVKDMIEEPNGKVSIKSEVEIKCFKQILIKYGMELFQ